MIPHSKPTLDNTDIEAVTKIIKSEYIAQGKYVRQFEKTIAKYIGVKDGVAVNSGTSALYLALISLGVKLKDSVVIPSYTCTALLNAVRQIRAKPIITDILDYNICPADTWCSSDYKTKAIIAPHMFGIPFSFKLFEDYRIPIIEDCAQAIGGEIYGKKLGSFGKLSIFSFYATKMITTGEGGMICSNNLKLLDKIRDIRDYDKKSDDKQRFNYKMTDIQASLGLNQLNKLDGFIKRRKEIAKRYSEAFYKYNFEDFNKDSVYYRYIINVEHLDKAIRYLKKYKIGCAKPIYKPLHKYLKLEGFYHTDDASFHYLSIPIYPSLTDKEVDYIIEKVVNYYKKYEK